MTLPALDAPSAYDIAEKSQETIQWLRDNIRVGFTDQRGPAWWAADDGYMADGTHFDGPVPQSEVDHILGVPLVEASIFAQLPNGDVIKDPNRKAIVDEDRDVILHVASSSYAIHPYLETLDGFRRRILDDDEAQVGSVGTLQNKGLAFIQAVLPATYEVAGYGYQPYFTMVTSANGKRATTPFTGSKATVCDNTVNMALAGAVTKLKIRHTRLSMPRIDAAREKLGIQLAQVAENIGHTIETLLKVEVSDKQWDAFLDAHTPLPEVKEMKGGSLGRGYTIAEAKRDELTRLYRKDPKVAPWQDTAFGVVQAVNTWRTWESTVKGSIGGRFEKNLTNDIMHDDADNATVATLGKVLDRKLSFA